jgi:hypothetical protein
LISKYPIRLTILDGIALAVVNGQHGRAKRTSGKGKNMKTLMALGAAGAVLAMAGIEGFSSGVASLAVLAAVGCWVMSGSLVE